jgi:hypothetical protein
MPFYTFTKLGTEETYEPEEMMTIAEMETWLKEHKGWDVLPGAPSIGDPVRLGRVKPSEGFRDVLRNLKKRHKHSTINTF